MFWAEWKKIWSRRTVVLLLGFSLLFFYSFMYQWIKPFLREKEEPCESRDSLHVKMEILSDWVRLYGNEIDAEEFQEIESGYQNMLYEACSVIEKNAFFRENGVYDYEGYVEYGNRAVSGKEGYDYAVYAGMRRLISENAGESSVWFQEYESVLQKYRTSGDGRGSILPLEVFVYANQYLVNLMIWCLVCVFLVAGFVMANDRENGMTDAQYTGKRGRKIYLIQYGCMAVSAVLAVSLAVGVSMLAWRTTGTFVFAGAKLNSFLNLGDFAVEVTFGEYVMFFVVMTYLLGIGTGSVIFCLSAQSSNVISMLLGGIPALACGGVIAFGMRNAFLEESPGWRVFGAAYWETAAGIAVLLIGAGVNVWNYRRVCGEDS